MPRKINLANHYESQELKEKYRKSKDLVEAKRWHLLWKISLGWTIKKSAMFVGISYSYARKIVKKYNEKGQEGIKNKKNKNTKHSGGKKALLNDLQIDLLIKALSEKPSDGGIWTGPKVSRWIEKETGKEKVFNQRGWDYLKKCKYSWQIPRPKHKKGCPIAQAIFKKNLPLKVKKLKKNIQMPKLKYGFLMNIE